MRSETRASGTWAIFVRFLGFGLRAWGGPIGQIAMLRHELAEGGGWVSPARFDRALAVYQALPGPEAHEMCVYLGMVRGGRVGGVAAGLGFMLPGLLVMLLLAWGYSRVGMHPLATAALAGAQPAVAALIALAAWRLGRRVLCDVPRGLVGAGALAAGLAGAPMLVVLLAGAAFHGAWAASERFKPVVAVLAAILVVVGSVSVGRLAEHQSLRGASTQPTSAAAEPRDARGQGGVSEPPALESLAGTGLRAGLLSFGGAYTALPFLRHDAVTRGAWMSESAFLDGVALAGVIPAPLIIVGTFVGFAGGGFVGALIVTATIFAPAFLFTLLGHEVFERWTGSARLHAVLDGVAAAVVGLIGATAIQVLAGAVGVDVASMPGGGIRPMAFIIGVAAFALLATVRARWIAPAVIIGAGATGLAVGWL
ncbi:MAG: chromate efflux transporter [Phycisphaerae bacterium]|nr:chromate efflux transporter [Phycisphaerae bacterium]